MILALFQAKPGRAGWERDKKNFVPSSVPTQPRLKHSQKNSIKIQKLKKRHSHFISSLIGLGQAEKEIKKKKKNRSEFHSYPTRARAFLKKKQKKFKKSKNIILDLSLAKPSQDRPKKR